MIADNRRQHAATRRAAHQDAVLTRAHVTTETDRGINSNLQNMRALHGVDALNNEVSGSTFTTDGLEVCYEDTTLGRGTKNTREIKEHVTDQQQTTRALVREEGAKARENAKLTAKRQTLSDMLTHENAAEWGGVYRDSTIKWLGGAADRVIGDSRLSPEQKEQAMNELIRMADEELVILDGDKEKFNDTYFPKQPKK